MSRRSRKDCPSRSRSKRVLITFYAVLGTYTTHIANMCNVCHAIHERHVLFTNCPRRHYISQTYFTTAELSDRNKYDTRTIRERQTVTLEPCQQAAVRTGSRWAIQMIWPSTTHHRVRWRWTTRSPLECHAPRLDNLASPLRGGPTGWRGTPNRFGHLSRA